jgi:hypothetical protein
MKIALIELDFHVDSVDGICKIFEGSSHELQIFTTEKNFSILKNRSYASKHSWHLLTHTKKLDFLISNESKINCCDGVFINTISADFGCFAKFNFKPTTILRIHNAYKVFSPWNHLKIYPTGLGIWKAISYVLREIIWDRFWYFRPQVVKKIDFFTFPDKAIEDFLLTNKIIPPEKVAPVLPIKVFDETVQLRINESEEINFTIPGGVDRRRRDYLPVLNAFRILLPKTNKKISLSFLGKCNNNYGKEIIAEFKRLSGENFRINYFEDFVPQADFDSIMNKTDVVISPVNADGLTQIYGEIYGKTKISGSITDVVLFPKPLIVPSSYLLNDNLKTIFDSYDSPESLSNLILSYANNKNLIAEKTKIIFENLKLNYDKKTILNLLIDFYEKHKK